MPTGVLDANVVIGLAKGGVFPLLPSLYAPLFVPPAVVQEVVVQGQGRPGAAELAQAVAGGWVTEVHPNPQTFQQFPAALALADREVLAVMQEQAADQLLTGDEQVRQEGRRHGFLCLHASEVVVLMKDQGLIPAVRPVLDQMRQQGFGIEDSLYQQMLAAAGE
jgi:predicted nucleic acid-binding protein